MVGNHQSIIYNATKFATEAIGGLANADAPNLGFSRSLGYCLLELESPQTFELRHICQTTKNNTGFGNAAGHTNFLSNVFAQVEITEIE